MCVKQCIETRHKVVAWLLNSLTLFGVVLQLQFCSKCQFLSTTSEGVCVCVFVSACVWVRGEEEAHSTRVG